ncbi:MAG: hypothetical protein FJY75_07925 [Candidatus Eisenbacteria bacterium]|uniref:Uncharacterized protein n=1 Tax=Eiseniibacteriota bacterium TaxID=2212470 RepID=A0A937XBB7_UNCEI|nr:hypothetical protein [Candidatus Eisenbacteria bacterium]
MEAPGRTEALHEQLAADLDRLSARLEQTVALVQGLRRERDELVERQAGLCREAGVRDLAALSGVVERWKTLEQENRLLGRERQLVAQRLAALLDQVDLLLGPA